MARDRSYYGLSKNDRVLNICGVPLSYLKKPVSPQQLGFEMLALAGSKPSGRPAKTVTPKDQHDIFQELLQNLDCVGQSALYGIGSAPTDQAAYQAGTLLTKAYYEFAVENGRFPSVKWIDAARPDWDFLKSGDKCDLLFVHGVTADSDARRVELCRDFVHRADSATKFVVALTPHIFNFMVHKLGLFPDGVFQLSRTVTRVSV
jgi:hypothetical protein